MFRDPSLFVYLLEDKGELTDRVVLLRERMVERNDELLTSALVLGELLVKPTEADNDFLVRRYEQAIAAGPRPPLSRYRSPRSDRPPDAIQPACASVVGVDLFITNDKRLSRRAVPGIQFTQSLEVVVL